MINSRVNTAEQLSPDRARISLATAEPNGRTALPLRKLPPLNALRCFEIAARHGSFTKAAEELLVTPAAVGQQVRQLEDFMGVALFRRENRRLSLTPAGESCLPGIREGFAHLAAAVGQAKPDVANHRLTISVAPSFGAKWLLPRLSDFEARHPEIDVHVDASMPLVDLNDGKTDIAIRYGAGHYPGLRIERLLEEEIVPVCSPALRDGLPSNATPADLKGHPLLHDDSADNDPSCPSWPMWLRAAGVQGIEAGRGPRFSQSSLVLEAAVLGRGIALAKAALAADDLAAGRLVRLFEISVPIAFAYYLVYADRVARSPRVLAFRAWIHGQVRRV